jgi:DNA-damage-inducible protein J
MRTDTVSHAQADPRPVRSARADILAGVSPNARQLEAEAAAVLADYGLSIADAHRLMLLHIVQDRALPFADIIPNAETIAAIEAARRGEGEIVTLEELQAAIDADD